MWFNIHPAKLGWIAVRQSAPQMIAERARRLCSNGCHLRRFQVKLAADLAQGKGSECLPKMAG
jgi:hypothetical protein